MEPEINVDQTADLVELLWSVHKPIEDLIRLNALTTKNDFNNNSNNNNNSSSFRKKSNGIASMSVKKQSDSDDTLSPTSLDVNGSTPPPPSPASDVSMELRHKPTVLSIDEDASFTSHPADFSPLMAKVVGESTLLSGIDSTPPSTTTTQSTPAIGGEDNRNYTLEALFQLIAKMQQSMETISKRFVNLEDAVFDLLDETRCPILRDRLAEKSVQTELSIGCQGLLPHMLSRRLTEVPTNDAAGENIAKNKSVFCVATSITATITMNAAKSKLQDKFDFYSSEEDSEDANELLKASKKRDTTDDSDDKTSNNSSSLSTPPEAKTQPSVDVVDEQPVAKKTTVNIEEKRRCVWADVTDDSDDTDSAALNGHPARKQSVHFDPKDNIPDEIKSAASLPWHDDKVWKDRVWKERQLKFEALHRQLNKTMAEHMLNRPKAAAPSVGASAASRVGTTDKLGVSPFNCRPITPTTTDSPSRPPSGQHAFFDQLQRDYILPPQPLYQQSSLPYHVSRPPTCWAIYLPNDDGGHHHRECYGYSRPHNISQHRSMTGTLLTGPNAIIPPISKTQSPYATSVYYNSQSQRSVSQPRRQLLPEREMNYNAYTDSKKTTSVGYSDRSRHHRRFADAFKLNARAGGPKLQPGRFPEKYNKTGYTRRGLGVYTTDEKKGGKK